MCALPSLQLRDSVRTEGPVSTDASATLALLGWQWSMRRPDVLRSTPASVGLAACLEAEPLRALGEDSTVAPLSAASTLKRRKWKMNKHKYNKRRKLQRRERS